MRVAIIGCGLIGWKRGGALRGTHQLVACADRARERAERLAADHPGCLATEDPMLAIGHPDVEAVIVATTHDALAECTLAAIAAGKATLVEKPAARSPEELHPVLAEAQRRRVVVKVGFNHRFHPALRRAQEILRSGGIGELLYLRGRYGHGGRPGYEREWRADPRISGGGELLDQGSHLIDLARWFAGDFVHVTGSISTYFWPMPVEDNAFALLRTATGQVAWLHASWTEWKNLFSFEVFGQTGKLQVDGLGGSYGPERLTYYRMLPEMGPPDVTTWDYLRPDSSWEDEFAHFVACAETGARPLGSLEDALASLEIVQQLYRQAGRDYRP